MKKVDSGRASNICVCWIIICIALGALTSRAVGWLVFGAGLLIGMLVQSQLKDDDDEVV